MVPIALPVHDLKHRHGGSCKERRFGNYWLVMLRVLRAILQRGHAGLCSRHGDGGVCKWKPGVAVEEPENMF